LELSKLVSDLRELISSARGQAIRAVDVIQLRTYWEVGRHLVEFEQGGTERAEYGKGVLKAVSAELTREFGKGFDITNLRHMRQFYLSFPIRDAVRRELSWTHYRSLIKVENEEARLWYMNEAVSENWSSRALDRQISTLYYDRLLISQDKKPVKEEAKELIAETAQTPREFVRDPVMLEFLGITERSHYLESDLEQALMDKLQSFLLELGKGFAFVARQQRVSTDTKDFYIDMVFYNYILKCFVLFDLKTGELSHQDIGQMDMYVRMYDELKRGDADNPTVGILLCSKKDASIAKYSVLNGSEQLFASRYKLVLPTEEELKKELEREREIISEELSLNDDQGEKDTPDE
jgi:predicted nuclease of restriction endonuclease-like (RecB) superfamily